MNIYIYIYIYINTNIKLFSLNLGYLLGSMHVDGPVL